MTVQPSPEFIVIGAAKAATTWIARHLGQRPDVFLPGPEPHYFSREYRRGPDWYAQWFADARPGQLIGEKSADYLGHPEAARRIAADLPHVKLIVQLRNPIERAYSDYCMFYRRGTVGANIDEHLRSGATPYPRFLEDGLYHRHLARFLDCLARDRIEIVLYDDIRSAPQGVIAQLESYLRLRPSEIGEPVAQRVNDSEAPLLPIALRKLLGPAKPLVARWRDRPWLKRVRDQLARPLHYPPLTDDVRAYLRDYYADDVERLSGIVHRDLRSWLAPSPGTP